MLANIVNIGGGDVDDVSLSNYTVRTAGKSAVEEAAQKVKQDFKTMISEDLGKYQLLQLSK